MAAGTVFFLTSARQPLYELLTEIDADDSLGIQKLYSWAEDAWVVFGTVMLVVFPLLMILLTAVVFGRHRVLVLAHGRDMAYPAVVDAEVFGSLAVTGVQPAPGLPSSFGT